MRREESLFTLSHVALPLLVVVGLVLIFLFMYGASTSAPTPDPRFESMDISVKNSTNLPYTISLPEQRSISLSPGEATTLTANNGNSLLAESQHYDGSPRKDTLLVVNPTSHTFYITYDGIRTNNNTVEGELVNESNGPVQFIQIDLTHDGRRWPYGPPIAPGQSISGVPIALRSQWEVVGPYDDNKVLGTKTITSPQESIVWTGRELI